MTTHMDRLHLATAGLEGRAASFRAAGLLGPTELVLVDTVARRFGEDDPDVLLGLALAVRAQHAGHVGIDLRRAPEQLADPEPTPTVPATVAAEPANGAAATPEDELPAPGDPDTTATAPDWPTDLVAWEAAVLASPLVGATDDPSRPFTRQPLPGGTLLMSRRMWREQERLADALRALTASAPDPAIDEGAIEAGVARLFPTDVSGQAAAAVRVAARHRLAVVTGGPGTGKTFSIKRLLALLLGVERGPGARPLRVELAAPTGKAAVRMTEAMAEELGTLEAPSAVKAALRALPARTLHRLLGLRPDGSSRYGAGAPLPADVVVVDEASMVDLVLMRRLVEAVGPGARLVLLGDRDQLASVEVGTVLADIVAGAFDEGAGPAPSAAIPGGPDRPLTDHIVRFTESKRFASAPTVATIAAHIQSRAPTRIADAVALMTGRATLATETLPHRVRRLGEPPAKGRPGPALLDALAAPYLQGYVAELAAVLASGGAAALRDPAAHAELVDAFDRYRVLAVHRRGALGVSGLERALGERVRTALAAAWELRSGPERPSPATLPTRAGHWLGEPILVTQNAYDVDLRNGDVGLILPGAEGTLCAVFPVVDRATSTRAVREVALPRLPPHSGALAMTVHKSQGSQFDHVALVLAGRPSPIQTRELVYTGVTRTKSLLSWIGRDDELAEALSRPIARASGLAPLLWR